MTWRTLAGILGVFAVAPVHAEHWPAWRGPAGNGISTEQNLPITWSKTEHVAWRLALPDWSGSTPIVWGDTVFLHVAEGDSLSLWAVDRRTGAARWKRRLGRGNRQEGKHNMSTPSPVTDGRHVWAMTGTGILKAFDFAGEEVWSRDIQADYGRFGLNWGYASSPLLHDGSLYIQVLHGMRTDAPSYLLRIDGQTGRTLWREERPTRAAREARDAYTTPALHHAGDTATIVIAGGDLVTGHDPATGRETWRAEGLNPRRDPTARAVASPLVVGDLVIAQGRERPVLAFRAGGRGNVTDTHHLWSFQSGSDVPTPVSDGRHVYVIRDNGVMFCLDARTGETVYGPRRLPPSTYSGSPVLADGRLYVTNEDGVTVVVRAGPAFEILAQNDLGEYTLSSLAISGGQIFVRTDMALYAIEN